MSTLKGLGNDVSTRTRFRTDATPVTTTTTTTTTATINTTSPDLDAIKGTQTVVGASSTLWTTSTTGADVALRSLVVAEGDTARKVRAGVAGALTALALVGAPALAQADAGIAAVPSSSTIVVVPQSTLNTRLLQLTTDSTTKTKTTAEAAFSRFDNVAETLFRRNAVGLSSGRGPLDDSSQLNPDEKKQLESALRDLVKELPIASLSPEMAQVVTELASKGGVSVDASTTRIRDLGHIGGDIAKRLVDELRHEKPAVFWGTAGTIAVAAGVGSIVDGSHVLRAIGVKPEVKLHLLDDKISAKIGLDWDKRFTNPQVHVGVSGPIAVGNFTGEASATVDAGGPSFKHMQAVGYTLSASLTDGGKWSGAVSVTGWPQDNRFQAGLGVGYHPNKNVEAFLQGTHDNKGDTTVGLGVRVRF